MTQIVPAILATSEEEYKQKLHKIEACPELVEGWVQIDLMDNKFVQNQSIGAEVIAKYPTKLKLEAQLMVEYPENWIDELIKTHVKRIVFPVEDTEGTEERVKHIKNHRIEVGLSINPDTPLRTVEDFIYSIDLLLIMSVNPGFGGQEFIESVIEKVREASKFKKINGNLKIEVDGGVTPEVARDLSLAGADYLVVGSHLLEGSVEENLEKFREALNG